VGWHPTFSNTEALAVLLTERAGHHAVVGRRLARKDAAITAAGAAGTAAAVIGTAAIVRRARKKNKA
jgi:hypothetical protein